MINFFQTRWCLYNEAGMRQENLWFDDTPFTLQTGAGKAQHKRRQGITTLRAYPAPQFACPAPHRSAQISVSNGAQAVGDHNRGAAAQ